MSDIEGQDGAGGQLDDEDDDDYSEPTPWWVRISLVAAVVALIGLGVGLGVHFTQSSPSPTGPEGVPIQNVPDLASDSSTLTGAPVDGITCTKSMNPKYHVHVHLDIFVNGKQERIPAGAGIVGPRVTTQLPGGAFVDNTTDGCVYWLHVHADDGIIHVEAPAQQNFVLGQFFDVWGQPFGPDQVGPATGHVTAFVNGKPWPDDPRNIPLDSENVVQLDVGSPVVAFKPMKFTVTGLCSITCSPATT